MDFDCLVQRAQECQPGTALLRQQFPAAEGGQVQVLARYEVVGLVQGQCHVRRTQVDPPPPPPPVPDAGQPGGEPYDEFDLKYEYLAYLWKTHPPVPVFGPRRREPLPAQMQCLYPRGSVAGALWRAQHGLSTQAELDLCYEGDGSCEEPRIPVLAPGCTLGNCLLGRWTFDCDVEQPGGRLIIHSCIGTRLSDENPGCALLCRSGRQQLSCRGAVAPAPGWEPIYLHPPDWTEQQPPEVRDAIRKQEAELTLARENYRKGIKKKRTYRLEDLKPEFQERIKAYEQELARERARQAQEPPSPPPSAPPAPGGQ